MKKQSKKKKAPKVKVDKKVAAEQFIRQNPQFSKWLHSCVKCEQQGYKPSMPNSAEPESDDEVAVANWNAFRTMRRLFRKMPLNRGGICESCFMGQIELPPTLHSFRHKIPRELSHVLQTTDFLTYMDGKIFELLTSVHYSDVKRLDKHYWHLLSVQYRGEHNKYLDDGTAIARVVLSVGAVPRQYRKGVREFLTQRLLPSVSDWLIEQMEAGVQNDNALRISAYRDRFKEDQDYISISERGKEIRRYVRDWESFLV